MTTVINWVNVRVWGFRGNLYFVGSLMFLGPDFENIDISQ